MIRKLLLFCLVALPGVMHAQEPREVLERARTNSWYVRALRGEELMAAGRVRAVNKTDARIGTTEVDFGEITALDRRVSVGGGGVAGAIVGGIVLGALFLPAGGLCEVDCSTWDRLLPGIAGFGMGLALGAVVGEVATPSERQWENIWSSAARR
jgi:hypothetical protein